MSAGKKRCMPLNMGNAFGIFRLEYLQGAARVYCVVVGHHSSESVCDFGLQVFEKNCLFCWPLMPITSGYSLCMGKQQVEVFRRGLQVCIYVGPRI